MWSLYWGHGRNRNRQNRPFLHIGKAFRGHGYMQEALNRIIKFAFEELDLDSVYALILNDNESSQKVVKSNNLEYSNTIEDFKDNVYEGPIDKYCINKNKWYELQNKVNRTK